MARIITENTRLPKGTDVKIRCYSSVVDEYYVQNVESDYCCWVKKEDLDLCMDQESEDTNSKGKVYGKSDIWNKFWISFASHLKKS